MRIGMVQPEVIEDYTNHFFDRTLTHILWIGSLFGTNDKGNLLNDSLERLLLD
jgi:hypothetical protein